MKISVFLIFSAMVSLPVSAALAQEANSTSIALDRFMVAPHGIKTAVVADASGHVFGIVQAVAADKSGRPRLLTVQMPGGRMLDLDAARVHYDFATHRVTMDDATVRTAQGLATPES